MFSTIKRKSVFFKTTVILLLFALSCLPSFAAGPPAPSIFSNPLAVTFIVLMILLLIIIAVLANILLGTADVKLKKIKAGKNSSTITSVLIAVLLGAGTFASAQDVNGTADQLNSSIGGMTGSTFYIMSAVIFLELFIILVLLVNIKLLLKNETARVSPELQKAKKYAPNWWTKINSFKPIEREADIDLGHEYDGIRELDNRLPPWWLYGFYITIIVSIVYLWRFHVSHTAPSSIEEYEIAMTQADAEVKQYLKQKGESVDGNTVTYLTAPEDIAAGQKIFTISCTSCHKETGAGDVGPNLTDDYWLHGGDVKSVFKTIKYGINAMPQWQNAYSNKQIAQVVSFLKTLHGTNPPNAKAAQGELFKEAGSSIKSDSTASEKDSLIDPKKGIKEAM